MTEKFDPTLKKRKKKMNDLYFNFQKRFKERKNNLSLLLFSVLLFLY